jgi:hypothetical protein
VRLKYVDSTHAYYLDGKRCKSVTSVAKIPEDTFRLEQWQQRQVAIGLAMKPSLLETIAANVDNNQKINEICEQAQAEAGAHEGRDRGDALHKALEQHDTGKRFIPTDLTSTAIRSWEDILTEQQWTVDLVERCVVWPDQKIAGRFDRVVRGAKCETCRGFRYVVDYKSGAKVLDYPHAISCQLTLYANAPILAGPIAGEGGETQDFEQLQGMCTCRAYVVHLPPDGDAQLIEIELSIETVTNIIFPTIAWRSRSSKSLARVVQAIEPISAITNDDDDPFAGLPSPSKPEPVLERPFDARQANIKDRLTWLKDNHPSMAQVVAGRWPEGVPSLRSNIPLTGEDMDAIEELLIAAERQVEAPFDPPGSTDDTNVPAHREASVNAQRSDEGSSVVASKALREDEPLSMPSMQGLARREQSSKVDEGPDMAPTDVAALKQQLELLDAPLYDRINEWVAQANNAGTPISMRSVPSKRRFSIARAMLLAVHHDEEVMRAVLSLTIGDEIQTTITTGSVLGSLTQIEAEMAWAVLLGVGHEWEWRDGKLVAA